MEKNETEIRVHNDKITPAKKRSTIVIDDIDNALSPLYELLTIDAIPTFTILSDYAYSFDAINILHNSRRETLIHFSMELHNQSKKI